MTDDDVVNAHRYCARLKMKHRASSLNSAARLLEWLLVTPCNLEYRHFSLESIQRRSPMVSKENKRKYADEEEEEAAEESMAMSKK
jgi:hypothetical protein